MRIAELNTTLRKRFDAVRGAQGIAAIAAEIGIAHITLCTWIAQYHSTRLQVLAKIETWIEAQEAQRTEAPHAFPHE